MTAFTLDCTDQLEVCAAYHARWAVYFRELATRIPQSFFFEQYQAIYAAYGVFQQAAPENQASAYLTYAQTVLYQSDFEEPRKRVLAYVNELAEWMLGYFGAELDKIFADQPFSAEQVKYRLNADLHASQLQRVSQAFHHYTGASLTHLQELKAARAALAGNYDSVSQILNSGFDLAAVVKSAASGWLAVAMPWIGIPALVAAYTSNSNQTDNKKRIVVAFEEQFQRYLESLHSLTETFPGHLQTASDWMHRKFTEINVQAISQILTDLIQAGYSIDHYVRTLDYGALAEAEQQITS